MTDDWLEARYEKDPNIVYREIAGEAILVPIHRGVGDMDSIYTLNEVGVFLWKRLDGDTRAEDLKAALLDEYDVSARVAEADLFEFLQNLEELGAVRRV